MASPSRSLCPKCSQPIAARQHWLECNNCGTKFHRTCQKTVSSPEFKQFKKGFVCVTCTNAKDDEDDNNMTKTATTATKTAGSLRQRMQNRRQTVPPGETTLTLTPDPEDPLSSTTKLVANVAPAPMPRRRSAAAAAAEGKINPAAEAIDKGSLALAPQIGENRRPQCPQVYFLLDVDSFEVQVYQKYLRPDTIGKKCIVANSKRVITAVSQEAKLEGISREENKFVGDARKKCPGLVVIQIPDRADNGKPDFKLARKATNEIVAAIQEFCAQLTPDDHSLTPTFEYSSRDEFYVDCSAILATATASLQGGQGHGQGSASRLELAFDPWPKSIVETSKGPVDVSEWTPIGDEELQLFWGMQVASDLLRRIKAATGFRVSIGVGPNKLLAKLACGHNKPAAVTLIPRSGFEEVSREIQVRDVPKFGGEMGKSIMKHLGPDVSCLADLKRFSVDELANVPKSSLDSGEPGDSEALIGQNQALEFFDIIRGRCNKPIVAKEGPDSISCTTSFTGDRQQVTFERLVHEMRSLVTELMERAVEEKVVRHRVPLTLKFTIAQLGVLRVSRSLEFPTSRQTLHSIVDQLLKKFGHSEEHWQGTREILKLEVEGRPFKIWDAERDENEALASTVLDVILIIILVFILVCLAFYSCF